MKDSELDNLIHKLGACTADIPPDRDVSSFAEERPYGREVALQDKTCRNKLEDKSSVNGAEDSRWKTAKGIGIVTGVAILRTRKATSEICSVLDIKAIAKGAEPATDSSTICTELQAILKGNSAALSQSQIVSALSSISAEYKNESYKTMNIHDHASVLAIHWLPVDLRESGCTSSVHEVLWTNQSADTARKAADEIKARNK